MKALIFNSGLGNRMGDFTRSNHKSMATVGEETIFARQIRLLASRGVQEFVITTGPFVEQLEQETRQPEFEGLEFTFVPNLDYATTNYIYSFHLAAEHLDDDCLMLHGDLVFNSGILDRLLADPRPDLGLINPGIPQPEKDFKAQVSNGVITAVGVDLTGPDSFTFQPLYKLSRRAMQIWLGRVAEFVSTGRTSVYAENAFNEVADRIGLQTLSYEGDSVNEVDTLEDLARVDAEIAGIAEQEIHAEVDAARQIPAMLKRLGVTRLLVVGGSALRDSGIPELLAGLPIDVTWFDGYSANPTLEQVQAGLRQFREGRCDGLLSVGGGSAMDVAKAIKALVLSPEGFPDPSHVLPAGIPHLAVPATAGTGAESTHFAVVYIAGEKHSIAHQALLPEVVFLIPELLAGLPERHRKAAVLDAISQCVESLWAKGATVTSRAYATAGLQLILASLFGYFHKPEAALAASRRMLLGANLGGRAINISKTTAPHAMSYRLTSRYGIPHGEAAALCLEAVWGYFNQVADTDPALAQRLVGIQSAFGVQTPKEALNQFRTVLEFLQVAAPPLPQLSDLDDLVAAVNPERLDNSPIEMDATQLRRSYEYLFRLRRRPYDTGQPADQPPPPDPHLKWEALSRLRTHLVAMLADLDEFCAAHGLTYYLSEGSMLGAVRHGGMIPWDDDIDIMMPRPDFDRFLQLGLAGELPEHLNLDCFRNNPNHWVFGAKIQLKTPTEFWLPKVSHLAHFDGPFVDVFPVDAVLDTTGWRFGMQKRALRLFRRMLFMKSGRSRGLRRKFWARIPIFLFTQVVPMPVLKRWIVWMQTQFNSSPEATHWGNLCSYYPLEREVFPADWFGTGRQVCFEGISVVVPDRVEAMLGSIYGPNFMGIPPVKVKKMRQHAYQLRASTEPLG